MKTTGGNVPAGGRLEGLTGIVTGGAQGIGAATIRRLVAAGAGVRVFDLQVATAEALAAELSLGRVKVHEVDLTDDIAVEAAIAHVAADGPIDFVVNNAGARSNRLLVNLDESEVRRLFAVNVRAVEVVAWHAARWMIAHHVQAGWIVNIASIDSFRASAEGLVPYAASKHAVLGLTRAIATALAPSGILVNAVCPGPVLTAGVIQHINSSGSSGVDVAAQWDNLASLAPLGRLASPADIALAVEGLIGPGVNSTTGATLVVDAGISLRPPGTLLRSIHSERSE